MNYHCTYQYNVSPFISNFGETIENSINPNYNNFNKLEIFRMTLPNNYKYISIFQFTVYISKYVFMFDFNKLKQQTFNSMKLYL